MMYPRTFALAAAFSREVRVHPKPVALIVYHRKGEIEREREKQKNKTNAK